MGRPSVARSRRNGVPHRRERPTRAEARVTRGAWLAPVFGATIIVTLAWAASLAQASPEIFVAASLIFTFAEGVVLALVATVWSPRGVPVAVGVAVATAILATPGRWELATLRTGQSLQPIDLAADAAANLAWAAFAGLAGATVLRERLSRLLPRH